MCRSEKLDPVPPDGTMQLVEATNERLVVVIPPGSRRGRAMARFATFWLLITVAAAGVAVAAISQGGNAAGNRDPGSHLVFAGVIGLFMIVGVVLAFAALRMSRTRLFIALEPHQLALRDEFLGRSKTSVLPLDSGSRATLEEAYSEGDESVFRVCVSGLGPPAKLATGCTEPEKRWLMESINRFLGVADDSRANDSVEGESTEEDSVADESGARAVEATERPAADRAEMPAAAKSVFGGDFRLLESAAEMSPDQLPEDSRLRVDDTEPGVFQLSYPVLTSSRPLLIPFIMAGIFEIIWICVAVSIVVTAFNGDRDAMMLIAMFGVFMIAVGIAPFVLLSMIKQARVSVSIVDDTVIARIGVIAKGWHRAIPRDSILDIGIGQPLQTSPQPSQGRKALTGQAAVIWSSHTTLPVGLSGDREFLRQLCGLIRYGLNR